MTVNGSGISANVYRLWSKMSTLDFRGHWGKKKKQTKRVKSIFSSDVQHFLGNNLWWRGKQRLINILGYVNVIVRKAN